MTNKFGMLGSDSDAPDPTRGEHVRVLLIEDCKVDALMLRRLVSMHGCTVELAGSVEEALRHLRRTASDVAILDLGLPDAQGLTGLQRIHRAFPHMPIVVVTGQHLDDGQQALKEGAQDFVRKENVDADVVMRSLRYAMARKQSETLRQRLEHTDRLASLGQLAAGIAHEINNPLAFIMANNVAEREHFEAFAELVDRLEPLAADHPRIRDLLAMLEHKRRLAEMDEILRDNMEGCERIRTIVRDLRGFARSDSDQLSPIDLNETVLTACNITRNEVRHRAKLLTKLEKLPVISGDQGRLCQVVVNLLVNAAQAIEDGNAEANQIEISTRTSANGVVLRVRDTGCGIAEEQLSRIFEPFYTTKGRDTGTGLGLSLCAETIHRHGGKIHVASQVGEGTTIEVRLPVHQAEVAAPPKPEPPRVAQGNGRVLLIDDEVSVRKAFGRMLRREGFEIIEAETVAEALQILGDGSGIDAIVCDLAMPEMDGVDLYRELEEHYPELRTRTVFISGGAFTSRTREFVERNDVQVIQKPPKTNALEAAVRELTTVAKAG